MTQNCEQTYMIDGVQYTINREYSKDTRISDILLEMIANHSKNPN